MQTSNTPSTLSTRNTPKAIGDLNDLRFVAAVAEIGTLAGAARRLGINHATAFRRLEKIEAGLGVRLFERRAGRYAATESGEELARAGALIERAAGASWSKVAGRDLRPSGIVRITTTEGLAARFAGPIALACRQRHPEITLHLIATNEIHSLSRRDADIALRASTRPPEDLIGKRLGTLAHAVYGAKRYLRRTRHIEDLHAHEWIALDDSMSRQVSLKWLSKLLPPEQAVLRTNSFVGVQRACRDGMGLAVLPCFLGDNDTLLERASAPLEDCKNELWLLMHLDLRETVRMKAIFQVIQEEIGKAAVELAGTAARASRVPRK